MQCWSIRILYYIFQKRDPGSQSKSSFATSQHPGCRYRSKMKPLFSFVQSHMWDWPTWNILKLVAHILRQKHICDLNFMPWMWIFLGLPTKSGTQTKNNSNPLDVFDFWKVQESQHLHKCPLPYCNKNVFLFKLQRKERLFFAVFILSCHQTHQHIPNQHPSLATKAPQSRKLSPDMPCTALAWETPSASTRWKTWSMQNGQVPSELHISRCSCCVAQWLIGEVVSDQHNLVSYI